MSTIRPSILNIHAYSPGKPITEVKRELGLDRVIKLASNENPLGPSPKAVEAVLQAANDIHLYPDGAAFELRHALASFHQMPFANVTVANGSDELIHLLGLITLGSPDDEVVVGDPSFVRYDVTAQLVPCKLIKVPLDKEFKHDLPAMAKAITPKTKMVFIANPNNPTGTIVRKAELDAFVAGVSPDVLIVLDEAYYEFAQHVDDYPVSTEYIMQGRHNVVGLRTFSKAYGLAGIRLGFALAHDEVADALNRVREPFSVNSLAQAAGLAALQDQEHLTRTLENNQRGIERLTKAFTRCGAKPCESYGNFVFADIGRPAKPVFETLLRRGVIVRSGEIFGCPNSLRVTIGTEEEMEIFAEEFAAVIGAGHADAVHQDAHVTA